MPSLIAGLIIRVVIGAALSAQRSTITTTITSPVTVTRAITETITREGIEQICFLRVDDCASIIVRLIDSAEKYVYAAVYSFASDTLRDALIRAKNRTWT